MTIEVADITAAIRAEEARISTLAETISGLRKLGNQAEMVKSLEDELNKRREDLSVVCPSSPVLVNYPADHSAKEVVE